MGRSIIGGTIESLTTSYSSTQQGYLPMAGGMTNLLTQLDANANTEAQREISAGGTSEEFGTNVRTNSTGSSVQVSLRVNDVVSAQSVAVTASTTGVFVDTDDVSISDGDTITWYHDDPGFKNMQHGAAWISFNATTNTHMVYSHNRAGTANEFQISGSGDTEYAPISGLNRNSTGTNNTDAETRCEMQVGGTFELLRTYIHANSYATLAATLDLRKNGADGNQSISITAATTGYFEDNTNTDTFVAGDDMNYEATGPAESGTIDFQFIAVNSDNTADAFDLIGSHGRSESGVGTDGNVPICGDAAWTEADDNASNIEFPFDCTFSDLRFYLITNSGSDVVDFGMDIAGSNGSGSISAASGAGTTGLFSDTSNSETSTAGDAISFWATQTGAGVNKTLGWTGISAEEDTGGGGGSLKTGSHQIIIMNGGT